MMKQPHVLQGSDVWLLFFGSVAGITLILVSLLARVSRSRSAGTWTTPPERGDRSWQDDDLLIESRTTM